VTRRRNRRAAARDQGRTSLGIPRSPATTESWSQRRKSAIAAALAAPPRFLDGRRPGFRHRATNARSSSLYRIPAWVRMGLLSYLIFSDIPRKLMEDARRESSPWKADFYISAGDRFLGPRPAMDQGRRNSSKHPRQTIKCGSSRASRERRPRFRNPCARSTEPLNKPFMNARRRRSMGNRPVSVTPSVTALRLPRVFSL